MTGRTYAGESAADRSARRRAQLLEAGLEVFGGQGYRTATVRGICRVARVADRNFYEEFDSTETLLLAVYDECTLRLQQAATQAVLPLHDDDDASAVLAPQMRAGLHAFLAAAKADPRLARVVWLEVLGVSTRVELASLQRMRDFGDFIVGLLPTGVELRADTARCQILIDALVGGISHVVTQWMATGFAAQTDEVAAGLTEFLSAVAPAIVASELV